MFEIKELKEVVVVFFKLRLKLMAFCKLMMDWKRFWPDRQTPPKTFFSKPFKNTFETSHIKSEAKISILSFYLAAYVAYI